MKSYVHTMEVETVKLYERPLNNGEISESVNDEEQINSDDEKIELIETEKQQIKIEETTTIATDNDNNKINNGDCTVCKKITNNNKRSDEPTELCFEKCK